MRSEFVSSANIAARIFQSLANAVHDAGGGDTDLRRLETDRALARRVGEIIVSGLDLDTFFTASPGLYVWDSFQKFILSVATPAVAPSAVMEIYDLPRDMTDAEIRTKLGEGHLFENTGEFCAILTQLIDAQWGGRYRPLLTNGSANIFYVRGLNSEVFAVSVNWDAEDGEWDLYAYRLGDDRRRAGYRAFSRNCIAA